VLTLSSNTLIPCSMTWGLATPKRLGLTLCPLNPTPLQMDTGLPTPRRLGLMGLKEQVERDKVAEWREGEGGRGRGVGGGGMPRGQVVLDFN